jgi:hypothetical protein
MLYHYLCLISFQVLKCTPSLLSFLGQSQWNFIRVLWILDKYPCVATEIYNTTITYVQGNSKKIDS